MNSPTRSYSKNDYDKSNHHDDDDAAVEPYRYTPTPKSPRRKIGSISRLRPSSEAATSPTTQHRQQVVSSSPSRQDVMRSRGRFLSSSAEMMTTASSSSSFLFVPGLEGSDTSCSPQHSWWTNTTTTPESEEFVADKCCCSDRVDRKPKAKPLSPVMTSLAHAHSSSSSSPSPSQRRNNNNNNKKIEVEPGKFIPLRGAEETHHAIQNDFYITATCLGCNQSVVCIADASYVLCPHCKTLSPTMTDNNTHIRGGTAAVSESVGLGLQPEYLRG